MPALITGANGQLGRELQKLLPDAIITDRDELDITDAQSVADFDWSKVDVIYNAAAYTAVDKAETDIEASWDLNVTAVVYLAQAALGRDIPLVHISTDYVFDGTAATPYQEDHLVNPQGMYGRTKAASELAATIATKHYIVRASWVYGDGNNFVRTMLKLGVDRPELTVVSDQMGRPTSAKDLAAALVQLVANKAECGTYHFQNAGEIISWAEFATAIFADAGVDCKVTPVTTAQYVEGKTGIAPRPAYGALDLAKITAAGVAPRAWPEALKEYIQGEQA